MRILLLAICLLPSTFLLSQNLQDYPAPLPDHGQQDMPEPEAILNDPLSVGYPAFVQHSNQRTAYVGQSATNEGDRLIFDSLIWEVYDEEKNAWEFSSMYWYERDERGNPLLYIYRLFDSENQNWIYETKREKTFNNDDFETSFIEYSWKKELEAWIPVERHVQAYDEQNRKTLDENYEWSQEQEDWGGKSKKEYVFNDVGETVLYIDYFSWNWESKEWIPNNKHVKEFNVDNLITSNSRYYWNTADSDWAGNFRKDYNYSVDGLNDTEITFDWNADSKEWDFFLKELNSYNDDDLKTLKEVLHWNNIDLVWETYLKHEYEYDDKDSLILDLEYTWNWNDLKYDEYSRQTYVYRDDYHESIYSRKRVGEDWRILVKDLYWYDANGFVSKFENHTAFDNDEEILELVYSDTSNWHKDGFLQFKVTKRLNPETKIFENESKSIAEYTAWGHFLFRESYSWNNERQSWYGTSANYYGYDEREYWVDYKYYNDWDFETSSWIGYNRYTYEVNDHNKRLSSDYYNWIDGDWKYTYRSNFYFHLDCSSSSAPVANYLVLEDQTELCSVESLEAPTAIGCGGHLTATTDAEFPIEAVGTTEVTWTYEGENGNKSAQTQNVIIDQSCQPLSVELNNLVDVYPNPSLGQINFKQKIDEVEVFNQTGQLEMKIHSPGSSINVSNLKAGIYYLTLKYQTNTARVKIIKN